MKTRIAGRTVFHGPRAVSPWGLRRRTILHGLAALGAGFIALSGFTAPATAGPEGAAFDPASASWLATVESQIAKEEYHFTRQTGIGLPGLEASWQAPNRAQGFRTYLSSDGVRVIPRDFAADPTTAAVPKWEWRLRLARWGRPGDTQPVEAPTVRASGNTIDYDRTAIVESYLNEPRGLEQLFTLAHAPEGPAPNETSKQKTEGSLACLELSLEGSLTPYFSEDGQAIDFAAGSGLKVIHYASLRVTDATGRELRAWMEGFSGPGTLHGIRIAFEDEGAVYPVRVDPLATTPAWTDEGKQGNARFGLSVATAGDVNGDGYSDVIVGAPLYDGGLTNEGEALVYLGSAMGLAANPVWTQLGAQIGAEFGYSVATAGDVNGDGYSDVIIGQPFYDSGMLTDEGRALVYLGSAGGPTGSGISRVSNQTNARFGFSVSTAGDVNGDGFSDVIIGANLYASAFTNEGRAYVFTGTLGGISLSPIWTADGGQGSGQFGFSVATAGDVNGDGYADVIVGQPFYDSGTLTEEGRAVVYLGSATGPTGSGISRVSNQTDANFGFSVSTAGDVNGDGLSDVIIGARQYTHTLAGEGRASVFSGTLGGISLSPIWTAYGGQANANFGHSVSTGGDINGDGYADVIVGAPYYDNAQTDEGRAFVYFGSASGPAAAPVWTTESDQASAQFGFSVATAGDVNGDGYADVIVGAQLYDGGGWTDEGKAFVYLGSADGLVTSPAWTGSGDENGAFFGYAVATAGDVNGDGYSDILVGAYGHDAGSGAGADRGQAYLYLGSAGGLSTSPAWTGSGDENGALFGISVATAGDVNGDGYSDVLVGAYLHNAGAGPSADRGRAYLYLGSAGGLATSPAWTGSGDENGALFGAHVATAGDVNGDGYSDVLMGAEHHDAGAGTDTNRGRAYLYLGSATGLATSPAWTGSGDENYAFYGYSVATAGDVNGDGYSDVIVSAPAHDAGAGSYADRGRAYLYLGSAGGLATSPAWTGSGDEDGAGFGVVAAAGDVNGDRYSDVLVGAYGHDAGAGAGANRGRAYLYYVNGDGLDRIPRQARTDAATPIALLGKSDSETGFRLRANGRTAAGRGKVRLQWEVKPLGTPFNGTGMGVSSPHDTGAPGPTGSATTFNESIGGLAKGTFYHWRSRSVSKDPFFPRSPWMSLAGNNVTETKLRTSGCIDLDGDGYGAPPDDSCSSLGGDCNDNNGTIWATPGETANLRFASKTTLTWDPPANPGALTSALVYDTLRSGLASDFGAGAICVESNDGPNTTATDLTVPSPGNVLFYLTRAEDFCPTGTGSLGTDSTGIPRAGRSCP